MDYALEKKPGNDYFSLKIENGDFGVKDQKIEIQQRVLFNLLVFRGENFASPFSGLDYLNNVFPFEAEDITPQDAFKQAILQTTGVISLKEFNLTQELESLKLKTVIDSEDGEIEIVINDLI
jgi:hypothetical protein